MTIRVVDARVPLPSTSSEMVREVERALGTTFRNAGFRADGASSNAILTLTVAYKDPPMSGYSPEDCIWISAKMTSPTGSWMESRGGACFEYRNLYGMHLGGDASRAYETALSSVIEELDRAWGTVAARTPGPPPALGRHL